MAMDRALDPADAKAVRSGGKGRPMKRRTYHSSTATQA